MPWYANGFPQQYDFAANNQKVSPWPHPNGPRIDCRFRFNYGQFLPAPRPSQFFFRMNLAAGGSGPVQNGSVKLLAVSDVLLQGNAGTSADGYTVIFEIELFEFPVVEPHYGTSGIRYNFILQKAGFPDLFYRQFWPRFEDGGQPFVRLDADKEFLLVGGSGDYSNFDPLIFTYITNPIQFDLFAWWPLSECVVLEEDVGGFAEMNGVDSWVKFTTWFPNGTTRFLWEYEIRPTAPISNVSIRGDSTNGAFFMGHATATNAVWWNRSVNLAPGLVTGIWQSCRMEHDWSIPGDFYTFWIDGVQNGQNAGTFTPSWFDEIGKVGPNFRGTFDLRNIKHTTGTPAAPNVILDFPLLVDACPVVGSPIKGTTFNMTLPSCP